MSIVIFGNPFFKEYNIVFDAMNNLLQLPDLTVQLNTNVPEKCDRCYPNELTQDPLILAKKLQIAPQSQKLLESRFAKCSDQYHSCSVLVFPTKRLEDKC